MVQPFLEFRTAAIRAGLRLIDPLVPSQVEPGQEDPESPVVILPDEDLAADAVVGETPVREDLPPAEVQPVEDYDPDVPEDSAVVQDPVFPQAVSRDLNLSNSPDCKVAK